MTIQPLRNDTAAWAVGLALFLATILNGAATYAKRVGLVDGAGYASFWTQRCGPDGWKPRWLGLGRECVSGRDPRGPTLASLAAYTTRVEGREWELKAAKDAVVAAMMIAGFLWTWPTPRWLAKASLLLMALTTVVGLGALAGLAAGDAPRIAAGLRSFSFLPIALLWMPAASERRLSRIAVWGVAILVSQCALVPWELLYGVSNRPIGSPRASGTLVHPNTLGVVAVAVLGFGLTFSPSSRWTRVLWASAAVLVACSRSGVGWVVLILLATLHLSRRLGLMASVRRTLAIGAPVLALSLVVLLTGRADVLSSVSGRWSTLQSTLGDGAAAVAFGKGLGVGSNASLTYNASGSAPADSMVSLLLVQGGLVYLILFYAILLRAWQRSPRPEFLVAILAGSLGANVIEIFPVNVLLGLGLAFSLATARADTPRVE